VKLARAVRLAGVSRSAKRLQHQKPKALALKAPPLMKKIKYDDSSELSNE
jgi:hypothetical protein